MPTSTANFSIRIDAEVKVKLEALASILRRPRNYLINEAIERYIQEESWQLAEIQAGIAEDDEGLHLPHDDVIRDAYAAIETVVARRSS